MCIFTLFGHLTACGASDSQTNPSSPGEEKFFRVENSVPDHYIVNLKDEYSGEQITAVANDLVSDYGGVIQHIYDHLNGFSVQMPEAAAIALSQDPRVEYVEEEGMVTLESPVSNHSGGIYR